MQVRFKTELTCEKYVSSKAWEHINISECPIHPGQDCGFQSHGTYDRVFPPGTKIVRIYCPVADTTVSFLPDSFSSRLCGPLIHIELVISKIEDSVEKSKSLSESIFNNNGIRPAMLDFESIAEGFEGAVELYDSMTDDRWLKRRIDYVYQILSAMILFFPALFGNCSPTLKSFRTVLNCDFVLVQLRSIAESKLHEIPLPVGLNPRQSRFHDMGRGPPESLLSSSSDADF